MMEIPHKKSDICRRNWSNIPLRLFQTMIVERNKNEN